MLVEDGRVTSPSPHNLTEMTHSGKRNCPEEVDAKWLGEGQMDLV